MDNLAALEKPVARARGSISYDMDIEDYHVHPAISNSGLGLLEKAPRYYQYERFEISEEERTAKKRYFVMGSAFHTLILEKELFKKRFYVLPETYVNEKGEVKPFRCDARMSAYKDEIAKAQGRAVITHQEYADILAMATATVSDQAALHYIRKTGTVEPSIIWTDEVNGIECRCRPDLILTEEHTLVDFKTVVDASEEAFARSVYNYGYDRQAYFYAKGYEAVTGNAINKFVFIVVEKSPPYLVGVYQIDDVAMLSGQVRTEHLLEIYADCKRRDYWPGLNGGKERQISIPGWAAYKMENSVNEGASA